MFSNFINSVTDLANKMKRVTETDREFIESYLEGSWNNKLSAVFTAFYQYRLSLKALVSESNENYNNEIKKLEKENPLPNHTTPSGLFAIGFAKSIYDENRNIKIFKKFFILDYKAPNHPFELQDHLFTLYLYYMKLNPSVIPFEFVSQIDNVTIELVKTASIAMPLHKECRNIYIRISKSTGTIRKKASERRQEIIEKYYKIQEKQNMTDHGIAREIQNHFEEWGKKPPAPETIKKYLREEGLMKK